MSGILVAGMILAGCQKARTTPGVTCGDGIVAPSEQCDNGSQNSDTAPDACRLNCQTASCGDNVVDSGEACDPPDGTTCDNSCQSLLPSCGDGNLDPPGEECDDGNNTSFDGCDANCQIEYCGNGTIDPGETCDDNNLIPGDGCDAVCQIEPYCGDGNTDAGEQCDDGGNLSGDGCDANCRTEAPATCGNGTLEAGEQCDDGNTSAGDGCDANCAVEAPVSCGDGTVDFAAGEQCDDGNNTNGDGCSAACLVEVTASCGNGALDPAGGEECDDGNVVGGDGCSATCQLEPLGATCGDGVVQGLEICDDNNTTNGDGCNPTCNNTTTTSIFIGQRGQTGSLDDPTGAGVAELGGSVTMAADNDYLYFADPGNHRIRRVHIATRIVDTIAGDGTAGWRDDPVGLNARFQAAEGITTDGTHLWVGDDANCIIREIDLAPPYAVTTVAGSGSCANHSDGIGTGAEFMGLRGLTYWNGLIYLLNPAGPTLRTFNPANGDVVTIAGVVGQQGQADGNGTASGAPFGTFTSPRYITHDNSGVIYIADTNGNKIRSYNTATDQVGTLCGTGVCGYFDGPCASAEIRRPRGMASDGSSVYWVEFNENTIRQATIDNPTASTLAGTLCGGQGQCLTLNQCPGSYAQGVGTAALFDRPFDVIFHYRTNTLFVSDGGNAVIRAIR